MPGMKARSGVEANDRAGPGLWGALGLRWVGSESSIRLKDRKGLGNSGTCPVLTAACLAEQV